MIPSNRLPLQRAALTAPDYITGDPPDGDGGFTTSIDSSTSSLATRRFNSGSILDRDSPPPAQRLRTSSLSPLLSPMIMNESLFTQLPLEPRNEEDDEGNRANGVSFSATIFFTILFA